MLVTHGTRPDRPSSDPGRVMPDDLWSIVESCWVQQPSKRLRMSEVVRMLQKGHRHSPEQSHSADSTSSKDDAVTTDTDNQKPFTGSLPQQNSAFQNLLSHVGTRPPQFMQQPPAPDVNFPDNRLPQARPQNGPDLPISCPTREQTQEAMDFIINVKQYFITHCKGGTVRSTSKLTDIVAQISSSSPPYMFPRTTECTITF